MGIFRSLPPEETVALCERAWSLGVTLVEVPVPDEEAVPSFLAAKRAAEGRGKHVGAGTITTVEQLHRVHELGARFTVAPGLSPEVARLSQQLKLPHLPGVATSSEIAGAIALGMNWVKAFPAAQLGPGWIKAQLGPFPGVNFVATGGVDAENAAEFLDAGCRGLAVGSAFSHDGAIEMLASTILTLRGADHVD